MSTVTETAIRAGEFHFFAGHGRQFIYLVPSGGIFETTPLVKELLEHAQQHTQSAGELADYLTGQGFDAEEVQSCIEELLDCHGLIPADGSGLPDRPQEPTPTNALQTLVMNLTNQCNLACKYCYEYGEDKVATPEGKPKFMEWQIAESAIDFFFTESAGKKALHITFFGGETLMNFPLLKKVVEHALERAKAEGRSIEFSLTTNATLLTPAIIDFLAEHRIGVTVSIDGPPEMNALRVYQNGRPSYDIIEPKIRMLLERHRTKPIAARVTLTSGVIDVTRIFRHLTQDLGFHEVGFAPVTTASNRVYAIGDSKMDHVLADFKSLASEYLQAALSNQHHAFSNVSDTLSELHNGVSKSHPCGAAIGLAAVGPSGDIAPCHRFVDSDTHKMGHVSTGIDRAVQSDFLSRGHVDTKYECQTCWARPLCAGGCHHEAYVRYGDTGHPNLHYCDWIREWTDVCLSIYGTISVQNPRFFDHFERKAA